MSSALRARIATALLLAALVIGVLLYLPAAVAAVLIAMAIFAAGWEWAGFARLVSVPARLAYAAGIVLVLSGAEVLARVPGLAASTGSACHADSVQLSPVLTAMRVPAREGMGAVRFSLGRTTTWDELERVLAAVSAGGAIAAG